MAPRGIVAGDSHILNFGDVPLKGGGRKYTLVDVDDSGTNSSLAGDFLRFYIGNQISPFKVTPKDLFIAYVDGVKGKKMDKPTFLTKIENASNKDFTTHNNERIAKLTNGDKFSELAAVQPLHETSPEIQELFKKSSSAIQPYLNDLTILDVGYKSKTTGGSQGLPRFWFLLKDSQSNRHIYEMKMESEPATSLFAEQPDALARLENVADVYRPKEDVAG
ncbi:MAG: hypothetical protein J7501_18690, partial [Bdellovibrio sp.]|nr:hypothetical protein [Bdellovibrio sp.]